MAAKGSGVRRRATPSEPVDEAVRSSDVSPRQERVLSEITHELGNYFHKLYYWAELLREQRLATAEAEPAVLLEQTVRDLETFLKTALEFFRPLSVVPMPMSVDDLTSSIRALVMRHADPAPVRWQADVADGGATVSIDPGRFSFVLEALVRRLRVTEHAVVDATVQVERPAGQPVYVLGLAARGGEGGASVSVAASIEWAIVERLVDRHGGTIAASTTAGDRAVRLELPIRP